MAENNDYKEVAQNLKIFRKTNGLTQHQVAQVLGIDRSTYAYYESGRTVPGLDSVDKLLKLFKINYSDLFGNPTIRMSVVRDGGLQSGDMSYVGTVTKEERSILAKYRNMSSGQKDALLISLGINEDDE